MSDPGPLPELAWLPLARLRVDSAYQRTLETTRSKKLIERIVDNFTWAAFGAIMACASDEDWLIIDGQHRAEAARRRGDIQEVPAVVVLLTQASQAAAFVRANDRAAATANELFHAKVIAGDPEAVTIARLCKEARIDVTRYAIGAYHAPVNTTSAPGALYQVLRKWGDARLGRTLKVLSAAFRDQRAGLAPNIIRGCADAMAIDIDQSSIVAALREVGIDALVRATRGEGGSTMRDAAVRLAIARAYQRQALAPGMTAGIDRAKLMAGR